MFHAEKEKKERIKKRQGLRCVQPHELLIVSPVLIIYLILVSNVFITMKETIIHKAVFSMSNFTIIWTNKACQYLKTITREAVWRKPERNFVRECRLYNQNSDLLANC